MWGKCSPEQLAKKIPARLYDQSEIKTSKQIVYAHFFIGGSDWWVTEYDPVEDLGFGFACLNGDTQNSEWGYIPISELREIKIMGAIEVDFDKFWKAKPAGEVPAIKTFD